MDALQFFLYIFNLSHIHGEDGGHSVDRSNEDSYLTDPYRQQQRPGGLTISLSMTKDLRQSDTQREGLAQDSAEFNSRKVKKKQNQILSSSSNSKATVVTLCFRISKWAPSYSKFLNFLLSGLLMQVYQMTFIKLALICNKMLSSS